MGRSYTSGGKPVPFDFELDGVGFVAGGGLNVLEMSELAAHAEEDVNSAAGAAALAVVFRGALGEDYERFKRHCGAHGTRPDVLLNIMQDMVEHLAETPTEPSGRFSPGRPETAGTSRVALPETQPLSDEDIARYRAAIAEAERTRSPG